MPMKIPFELDPQFDSFYTGVQQMVRRVRREIRKPGAGAGGGGKGGVMESIFFPKGGKIDRVAGMDMKKTFDTMFRTMQRSMRSNASRMGKAFSQISAPFDKITVGAKKMGAALKKGFDGARGAVKVLGTELKGVAQLIDRNTKSLQKMAKSGGRGAGSLARKAGGMAMRGGRAALGAAGRGLTFAGMMGAQGIAGFVTSAFREAIGAYEAQQNARLQAAPYLTGDQGQRPDFASGARFGYNSAQAAGIQANAARQGLGSNRFAGRFAMSLNRAYGSEMLDFAAGIQRRRGTEIGSDRQMKSAQRELTRIFGMAVESGLKSSRMLEFTQATANYAEKQLAITPDKDSFQEFSKQLAFVQSRGGAGMMGRYGAQALSRVDSAIKGAGGPQQAFLMRAFGFGKGANYLDVVRRQEGGIADMRNLPAIMKQLQQEYGQGQYGGLSGAGLLAFKGMGFGSTSMAEKFAKMYLGGEVKGLTKEQQKKRFDQIMAGERDSKLAPVQERAYKTINRFGGVAQTLAKRFDQFAKLGAKWYDIKKSITDAAINMAKGVAPILSKIMVPIAKSIANFIKTFGPKLASLLMRVVKGVERLAAAAGGFISGYLSYKGSMPGGGLSAAFAGAAKAYKKMGDDQTSSAAKTRAGEIMMGASGRQLRSLSARRGRMTSQDRDAFAAYAEVIQNMQKGKQESDQMIQGAIEGLARLARKYMNREQQTHTTSPHKGKRVRKATAGNGTK